MANTGAPNSGGAQWFITTGPNAAKLDAQGTYTVFGDVTTGLDVAQKIAALATSATDDSMKREGRRRVGDDRRELSHASYGSSPWTTGSPTSSQRRAVAQQRRAGRQLDDRRVGERQRAVAALLAPRPPRPGRRRRRAPARGRA